ncbi:hypothetical protein L1887_39529 [Cichorium endivia]|nr:hypothetical protein L1887_39529 [Cichorium endivia]
MPKNTTPLIAKADAGEGWWWKKVLDWEEAKTQMLFALPMILINVAYYCIPLVSVMFTGHLGEAELAASNLANSWASVTGLAFMQKGNKFAKKTGRLLICISKWVEERKGSPFQWKP